MICGIMAALGTWPADLRAQLIDPSPAVPTGPPPTRTESLEMIWPGYPEWLAMFAEVLEGNPPFAGQGWYRKAVSRTRFDWKSVSGRFDRNRDGRIDRAEMNASDEAFRRLDRDRDGRLTESDFDFLGDARPEAMGVLFFATNAFNTTDRNDDARASRKEWEETIQFAYGDPLVRVILSKVGVEIRTRYELAAKAGVDFLTLADFQEAFTLTMKSEMLSTLSAPRMAPVGAALRQTLLRAFLRGDLGSMNAGPALEETAPDFTLPTADGRSEVTLSKLYPTKPVVLIFGNFTCGPFRKHAGSLEMLRKRYGDRAYFLTVYVREAHTSDGWQMDENVASRVVLRQPRDFRERVEVAKTCRKTLGLQMPVVIDGMDDRVATRYSGPPSRLYLIDREGKIAYKGGRAPFGFKPAELEQSLLLLLEADSRPKPGPTGGPIPPRAR
jgi:thiol-disulfide isomerase/thioredoxin